MTNQCRAEFEKYIKQRYGADALFDEFDWRLWQAAWEASRQPEQPAALINQAYEG